MVVFNSNSSKVSGSDLMVPKVCIIVSGSVGGMGVVVFLVALQTVVPVEVVPVEVPVEVLEAWAGGSSALCVVYIVPCASPGFLNECILCDGSSNLCQS